MSKSGRLISSFRLSYSQNRRKIPMLKNGEIIKIKLFNLEFPRVHKTRVLKIVPFSLETEDQCDLSSDRESILL